MTHEVPGDVKEHLRNYSAAGVLVVNPEKTEILLGNQKEHPNLWGNFGGKREKGESDPAQTALRELKEELGYEAMVDDLSSPLIVLHGGKVWVIYALVISKEQVEKITIPEDSEIETIDWFWSDKLMGELLDQVDSNYSADALWGGRGTYAIIDRWFETQREKDFKKAFGGIIAENSWLWGDPYANAKRVERTIQ